MITTNKLNDMKRLRATALIIKDGKALFLKRMDDLWTFPGGKVDPGETPEESCVRETEEESGLIVEAMELLEIQEDEKYLTHCFICNHIDGTPTITEPEKFTRVEWIDIEELLNYPSKDLTEAVRAYLNDQITPKYNVPSPLEPIGFQ